MWRTEEFFLDNLKFVNDFHPKKVSACDLLRKKDCFKFFHLLISTIEKKICTKKNLFIVWKSWKKCLILGLSAPLIEMKTLIEMKWVLPVALLRSRRSSFKYMVRLQQWVTCGRKWVTRVNKALCWLIFPAHPTRFPQQYGSVQRQINPATSESQPVSCRSYESLLAEIRLTPATQRSQHGNASHVKCHSTIVLL